MLIRIGTRGSKLALWQAEHVSQLLRGIGMDVETRIYKTEGDERLNAPLREIGGKGLFTKVLDDAMLAGEIDIAVHSSKDIPTEFDERLGIIAIPQREDPRDVLLAVNERIDLDNLADPMVIGTSSVRRTAFLQHYLPHVRARVVRGNVDTRIAKMERGEYDGIMLAYAGVRRLGLEHLVVRKMNPSTFTPAVGQGAIGIVGRLADQQVAQAVRSAANHQASEIAVRCERAFLTTLGGGCSTPAFALATVVGGTVSISGGLAAEDGSAIWRDQVDAPIRDAEAAGRHLAALIIEKSKQHTRASL